MRSPGGVAKVPERANIATRTKIQEMLSFFRVSTARLLPLSRSFSVLLFLVPQHDHVGYDGRRIFQPSQFLIRFHSIQKFTLFFRGHHGYVPHWLRLAPKIERVIRREFLALRYRPGDEYAAFFVHKDVRENFFPRLRELRPFAEPFFHELVFRHRQVRPQPFVVYLAGPRLLGIDVDHVVPYQKFEYLVARRGDLFGLFEHKLARVAPHEIPVTQVFRREQALPRPLYRAVRLSQERRAAGLLLVVISQAIPDEFLLRRRVD